MSDHYDDLFGRHRKHDVYGGPHDEPPAPDLGAEPVRNGPTRANHLAYCKQRALEYAPEGQPGDAGLAMSSLLQDLGADERTADSVDVIQELMLPLAMIGDFATPGRLRKFILEFG